MFIGSIFSSKESILLSPTSANSVKYLKLMNGIFDELYGTKNTDYSYTQDIKQQWDFDTIIHALFNGNTLAGNVDFTLETVTNLLIKIREKGTFEWITIFDIPVENVDSFKFEKIYNFCRGNKTEYEVAIVPIINNIEGNYNVNSVVSDFDGMSIIGRNKSFNTDLDINKGTITVNNSKAVITTLGSRYPYVIQNGESNYYTGSGFSATFIPFDPIDCTFKPELGFKFRVDLMNFLNDKLPKVLKLDDGRMWLISITNNPSEVEDGHPDKITTTFDWAESGDINSQEDLYYNGLIEANPEWWVK